MPPFCYVGVIVDEVWIVYEIGKTEATAKAFKDELAANSYVEDEYLNGYGVKILHLEVEG